MASHDLRRLIKKEGEQLFAQAESDSTRGTDSKLKDGRFGLGIEWRLLPVKVVRHLIRLPKEAVAAHLWRYPRSCLMGLGATWSCGKWPIPDPFQLEPF